MQNWSRVVSSGRKARGRPFAASARRSQNLLDVSKGRGQSRRVDWTVGAKTHPPWLLPSKWTWPDTKNLGRGPCASSFWRSMSNSCKPRLGIHGEARPWTQEFLSSHQLWLWLLHCDGLFHCCLHLNVSNSQAGFDVRESWKGRTFTKIKPSPPNPTDQEESFGSASM